MTTGPWPLTAARDEHGALTIGGVPLPALAAGHGTPLWVVDEEDLRTRCRAYVAGFPGVEVTYASKAWCTVGLLQLVDQEGLKIDVASGGELYTALVAGIAPERLILHGNNKSEAELAQALDAGVGRIVVDSFEELDRLERLGAARGTTATVWLRITPGIDAHTHEYVRTGHDDAKFGFTLSLGLADEAFTRALALSHVEVVGVHAHIGSQIFGTDPFIANAEVMLDLLARWRAEHGVTLPELNLGGGMGIRYTHEDHPVEVRRYGKAVLETVAERCEALGYPEPQLFVEPGRAVVGPSTVTLYEVGTIKPLSGLTTWVSVDGGMSDNIRPALYDAEHEVTLANRTSQAEPQAVTVVGKHCESGDLVREHAPLPADLVVGDLLAVAATGAYTASMASNYNRLVRPGAVLVRDGEVRELVRRERFEDLVSHDIPLT